MPAAALTVEPDDMSGHDASMFYRHVLQTLHAAGIATLIGGAYAFRHYTGIARPTKDLDIFLRRGDIPAAAAALRREGYETEMTFPHWLAKIYSDSGADFVDVIFSSGNGIAEVDDEWFAHAQEGTVLDLPVRICPAEESIWSKAFIMERERFDGADIAHLIRAYGSRMDWERLQRRFEPHWRVLLSHLVLFGFAYPGHRDLVPAPVMHGLMDRLREETDRPPTSPEICQGSLLSREQYLIDIEEWGYRDARVMPLGNMTPRETAIWTDAIPRKDGEADPH
ncbi:hypothetical protein E4K72_13650 [Oxalobacteraceae bacterium OM1]|nr:hypothetical protein E4K72_13650 [Oxalobacteraceae bacterium OM1]